MQLPASSCPSKGSSPLELVATVALLLLPIGPIALLASQLSNELAAESIARNALRMAILESPEAPSLVLPRALRQLEQNWNKQVAWFDVSCSSSCELWSLEVQVGGASAIHTMGIEP